jgi:magnesium transporter
MANKLLDQANLVIKKTTLPRGAVGKEIIANIPKISSEKTVQEVRNLLPELAQKTDSLNYLYVLNSQNQLVGVVSIKELLRHRPESQLKEVMIKNPVVSHPQVNQERVAHLAIKHNIKAVPIVDKQNKLLGILPSDKILALLYQQYRRSFRHFAGIIGLEDKYETILESGILKNIASRLPWIMIGLIGGIFAAQLIEFFQTTLAENLVLAAFIPLIVYISDAVGTQTQTFLVRDIAFKPKLAIISYTLKQFAATSLIGVVCGMLVWGLVSLFWQSAFLGMVIGLATLTAISTSTIIAVLIPYLLFSLKQDPASGSGPFATILQDLLSIFIYFLIASALL